MQESGDEGEEEEEEDDEDEQPRYSQRVRHTVQRYSPIKDHQGADAAAGGGPSAPGATTAGPKGGGGGRRRRSYEQDPEEEESEVGGEGVAVSLEHQGLCFGSASAALS